MSAPTANAGPVARPTTAQRFLRLRRLAIKELREILRDRRTLVTLVLMPFLLYPLFSLVLRKFMLNGGIEAATPAYALACGSMNEMEVLQSVLGTARPFLQERYPDEELPMLSVWLPPDRSSGEPIPAGVPKTPEEALRAGQVDVVVRIPKLPPRSVDDPTNWTMDCELQIVEGSLTGERALRHVEDCLRTFSNIVLSRRLQRLGIDQRASPIRATRSRVRVEQKDSLVSLSALIPFVLILMTITGAVYPAIDLTAGERERGTLELLIAAPVPRLGLLFAKYVAVVAVAMLTATVNLVAMTATISFSGLGPMLWGKEGLSAGVVLAVFALLFLLASLFAAVLLAITSFARSFKEAQAYLIPLMLCALGPGLISLMPGVELQGWLLVTPLLNCALLARDLLAGDAMLISAMVVVLSTGFYAFAALGIASKLFAAEAVFYDARVGWNHLWKRPERSEAASIAQALLCLACMFPVSFAALGSIGGAALSLSSKFVLMALATAIVYGGVPLLFARWRRVDWQTGFSWRVPPAMSWLGAAILGLSMWPFAHELVLASQQLGFASLGTKQLEAAQQLVDQGRQVPLWLFLTAIAFAPAIFEEFCFRGFVFGAVRARFRPRTTVLLTGVVFGVFHLVTSDALAVERLLPSTALGCVLGWVCWRTGSLFPGMLLHAVHNGFLALLIYFLPEIKARGWGLEEQSHMPGSWLAAAGLGCILGGVIIQLATSRMRQASAAEATKGTSLTPLV